MDFRSLAILSVVGLGLLAFGNQLVLNIAAKDNRAGKIGSGPLASLAYAARNFNRCRMGVALIVLGLLVLIASSLLPFFSYRAN